jgi:predicted amidohydrolase YtcJ
MTTRGNAFRVEGLCFSSGEFVRRLLCLDDGRIVKHSASGPTWKLAPDEFLLPAFHDHHTHLIGSFRPPRGPDLGRCVTRQGCLDELSRWLRENPGSGPVIGEGWDESAWDDRRPLTRSDLDPIARGRPVALRRVCGHIVVVNRAAWEALAPQGEEADEASGRLIESLALGIPLRWPASGEDDINGARRGQEAAHGCGVAAIDEMGRIESYRAFRRLEDDGDLLLRVNHHFPISQVEELIDRGLVPEQTVGPLRIAGLKGFLDGSIGGRTAAMSCPYRDTPSAGALLLEADPLAVLVKTGLRAGFSIALHAIGLRAVEQALGVYERVGSERATGAQLRIEHAEELDDRALARAGAVGVTLSMQPNFTARWQGPGGMYEAAIGSGRAAGLNRFASAGRSAALLFGSDTMPFGPLVGLVGALDHPLERERLSLSAALRAYMTGGIAAAPSPDLLGEGMVADLTVLRAPDGDLARSIRSRTAQVVWTAIAGRVTFCDPSASAVEGMRGAR